MSRSAITPCYYTQMRIQTRQGSRRLPMQQERAARGFRTSQNFIAIAYLRMSNLSHLPASPLVPATAK